MVMTAAKCPRARQDVVLQEIGREGLLYDRGGQLVHILNVTALAIWKSCDGNRDVAALETLVRDHFSQIDGHDVRQDIESLLAKLDERGLLENEPAVDPQRRV